MNQKKIILTIMLIHVLTFLSFSCSANASVTDNAFAAYDKGDYDKALELFTEVAEQGSSSAQYNVGTFYEFGRGVPVNYKQAAYWYKKSAEQGHAEGEFYLGSLYYRGLGVEQNFESAMDWFLKAAMQNHKTAQFNVANQYSKGEGVEQSHKEARSWFLKAAEQGDSRAMVRLANMDYFGEVVEKNYTEAFKWYTQAANLQSSVAQYQLGMMYYYGQGTEQNLSKSVQWLKKSAELGWESSMYMLGLYYEKGIGVTYNEEKALYWYKKLASLGNDNAQIKVLKLECKGAKIKLFSAPLQCSSRNRIRHSLQNTAVIIKREDDSYFADLYYPHEILEGSSELVLIYDSEDRFARAQYEFPSDSDPQQILTIKEMVESKYGPPEKSFGKSQSGRASFKWSFEDGILIDVQRGWPDTTTYLTFTHAQNYAGHKAYLDKRKKEKKLEKYKSQDNAF